MVSIAHTEIPSDIGDRDTKVCWVLHNANGHTPIKPGGAFSVPALATANLSPGYAETKILGPRPDGSHWPVELHNHQREAFPGLRHRPQKAVVFFRPTLVVI